MIRLTDEEIDAIIDKAYKDNRGVMPQGYVDKDIGDNSAKAQLKKVAEWGNEPCEERSHWVLLDNMTQCPMPLKRECPLCWQALLEEIK